MLTEKKWEQWLKRLHNLRREKHLNAKHCSLVHRHFHT
jgi:hypothetical protein